MLSLKKGIIVDGRFRIIGYLGSGGMGTVYQSEQVGLDRQVALKLLNGDLMHDRDSLARFEREAQVLSLISHPNVASFYAYGVWLERSPYIAMQLLSGDTLAAHIASQGEMTWRNMLAIAAQIARACAHLHDLGIVHRDLKPSNVFILDVEGESRVTITDFGLARIVDTSAAQRLTATGLMVGTPHYIHPELALGEPARPVADIYALGCMMYECLSGRPPFDADSTMDILYQHLNTPAPILPKIPEQVMSCILTAMAKDSAGRFASMHEMADAIAELEKQTKDMKDSKAGQPIILGKPTVRQRPWWQALSVVAVILAILLAALLMHGFIAGSIATYLAANPGSGQQALPIARALASVGDLEDAEKFFDVAVSQAGNGPDGALKRLDIQLELMKLYQRFQQPSRQQALLSSILRTVPEASLSPNFDAQERSAHRIEAIADWLSLHPAAYDDNAQSAKTALLRLIEHARGLGMTDPLFEMEDLDFARTKARYGRNSSEFQAVAWNTVNDLYYSENKSANRGRVCALLNDIMGNGLPPVHAGVRGRITWIWQNVNGAKMYANYDQKQLGARVLNLLLQHELVENDPFWQAYARMELAKIMGDEVQLKQHVYKAAAVAMNPSPKGAEEGAAERRISDELADLKDYRTAASLMTSAERDATSETDRHEFAWRHRDYAAEVTRHAEKIDKH